jgi:hypothetical protein
MNEVEQERKLRRLARRKGLFLVRLTGAARGEGMAPYAIIPQDGTLTLAEAEAVIRGQTQ